MIPLCRHIMTAGVLCNQAAVKNTLFCRHHQTIKQAVAQCQPKPDPYGVRRPLLRLVYPEDRAAIQTNLFVVLQALNAKQIDTTTANTMNRLLHSCERNLKAGPLATEHRDNAVQRVILTPDGEEVALPREVLEPGEKLAHGPECPCAVCAEKYRNAPMEQHHANCKCGLCGDSAPSAETLQPNGPAPVPADPNESPYKAVLREYYARQEAKKATEAAAQQTQSQTQDTQNTQTQNIQTQDTQTQNTQTQTQDTHDQRVLSRVASTPIQPVEPAANKYADPDYVPKGFRMYEEALAEVARNQQAGEEMWQRYVAREAAAGRTVEDPLANKGIVITHPDGTTSKRYLTWNEEEDLRVAARKKQKEEEAARQRQEAEALMAQCLPPVG